MTLTNSSVTGNNTGDGNGGGIFNPGTMSIDNSIVAGNVCGTSVWDTWQDDATGHGGGDGGGVYNSGVLTLALSIVRDNIGHRGYDLGGA